KEAVGLIVQPLYGGLQTVEVGLSNPQRPWQQQQRRVLGLRIGSAVSGGDLVPPDIDVWALDARVTCERRSAGRACTDLREDAKKPRADTRQRGGAGSSSRPRAR